MDGAWPGDTCIKRYGLWAFEVFNISLNKTLHRVSDSRLCTQSYLEFFVSPVQLDSLLKNVAGESMITYHAVNRQGDFRTNTRSDGPNAVTWGVFPGKEIQQPTIVEAISFMAWKVRASSFFLKNGC